MQQCFKKFIPEDAEVTLCSGSKYKVLETAQKISESITNNVTSSASARITVPGSEYCCEKPVKLSECEGGMLTTTVYGIIKTNELIQGPPAGFSYIKNDFRHFSFDVIGASDLFSGEAF